MKQQVGNYRSRRTPQCRESKTIARQILALRYVVDSHKNRDKFPGNTRPESGSCRVPVPSLFLDDFCGGVLQATLVHTAETTRIRYFIDLLLQRKRPVMLVGAAGTGKTVLINDRVSSLSDDDYMVTNIPFNFYTTSEILQHVMEKPLEKKAGRNYGPPGTKNLIYFVDDMNMPEVRKTKFFVSSCSILFSQRLLLHSTQIRLSLSLTGRLSTLNALSVCIFCCN